MDVCTGRSPAGGMFLMKEPTLLKAGATGEHLIYKVQDLLYDEVFSLYTSLPEVIVTSFLQGKARIFNYRKKRIAVVSLPVP